MPAILAEVRTGERGRGGESEGGGREEGGGGRECLKTSTCTCACYTG